MGLLTILQKQNVNEAKKRFGVNIYAEVWANISDIHKRWLLRAAFLQEDPEIKPWGGYSYEEKERIRTCALFVDEFSKHQRLIRENCMTKQIRINAAD